MKRVHFGTGASLRMAWPFFLFSCFAATAQTAEVVRTFQSNQYDLISVPLITTSNNQFVAMTTNVPNLSYVCFYDPPATNFTLALKSGKGLWEAPAVDRVVLPGNSFFLRPLGNAQIAFAGTVPVSPVTNQIYARWSALGYPYPVDVKWSQTTLASNLPTGTLVYFWSRNAQNYQTFLKGPPAKGGWGDAASKYVIHPGDGFIVRQPPGSTPFIWTE